MIRLLVTLALGASLLPAQLYPPAPGQKPLSWLTTTTSPTGNCVITTEGQVNVVDGSAWACVTGNPALNNGTWTQISGGGSGGINRLTGDVLAGPGSGTQAATLALVNGSVGLCGDATHVSQITLDAKGRATSCTPVLITGTGGITQLTGDAAAGPGSGSQALTFATVNSTVGTFGDSTHVARLTVDGKGRITAVTSVAISGSGGAATSIQAGPLSGLPVTCAAGDVYFATNQPAGEQLYQCSASNVFTQTFLHDTTIANTAGSFGVNLLQFCQFTNSCTVAARWDFSGAASTSPNKKGLAAAIPATCTVGDTYFATDATAGANIYGCTASNTWTPPSGGSVTTHYVLATNAAPQSIPSGVLTPITYDTNTDTTNAALHSTSSNPQNFVPDATGRWAGACQATSTSDADNFAIIVFINATAVFNNGGAHTAGAQNLPWSYPLTSGDIVTCQISSGGGLTASAVGTTFYMYLVH